MLLAGNGVDVRKATFGKARRAHDSITMLVDTQMLFE